MLVRRPVRWPWLVLPLVVWLGVIALNSTDLASGAHTDALLPKRETTYPKSSGWRRTKVR